MNEINKGTRIVNYVIDFTIICIIAVIIEAISNQYIFNIIYYPIYLVYYFSLESITGRTIGKIITKTIVVDMNNFKPSIGKVGFRTIMRLNPFDKLSYLFGQEQGGHDLISKTKLIHKSEV